jgi:hypothetical protein
MSSVIAEYHIKNVIEYGLKELRKDLDHHLADIFGALNLEPHAALMGNKTISEIKSWLERTKIPVVLGFDINESDLPCVSINLQGSSPSQAFIGDTSISTLQEVPSYKRDIIVAAFHPELAEFSEDRDYILLTLPDSMDDDTQALFFPGLSVRDANKREYRLSEDEATLKPKIIEIDGGASLEDIDTSTLELITPYTDAYYSRGAMVFNTNLLITIHGNSSRQDGLWLWQIVMWILLKYRPLMIRLFGIDLGMPSSSDFGRDDNFLGEHVWRRSVSLSFTSTFEWENAKHQDILGFILYCTAGQASSEEDDSE